MSLENDFKNNNKLFVNLFIFTTSFYLILFLFD